jgi:hypothetical protein
VAPIDSDQSMAQHLAERIEARVPDDQEEPRITVSIGMVVYPGSRKNNARLAGGCSPAAVWAEEKNPKPECDGRLGKILQEKREKEFGAARRAPKTRVFSGTPGKERKR